MREEAAVQAPGRRRRVRPGSENGARAGQARRDSRAAIQAAALSEFASRGYSGARIESIARAAGVDDRLIYYYFGGKDALYRLTLETAYERLNEAESALDLASLAPGAALEAVVRFTWRYYLQHPEFITLLNTENLHRGAHIRRSARVRSLSRPVVGIVDAILRRGRKSGEFRRSVSSRHVYLAVAALGYFYLSNRYTLSNFLGVELADARRLREWETFIVDAIRRLVCRVPGRDE